VITSNITLCKIIVKISFLTDKIRGYIKKIKNLLDTPFSPWLILATRLHVGIPWIISENEFTTHFEHKKHENPHGCTWNQNWASVSFVFYLTYFTTAHEAMTQLRLVTLENTFNIWIKINILSKKVGFWII
jgi:hypothetical protein